jgi:hypothetical protein
MRQKPHLDVPEVGRKLPRKDYLAYAPEKGEWKQKIQTGLSGNLEVDHNRIRYLYECLLSYTDDMVRGKAQ